MIETATPLPAAIVRCRRTSSLGSSCAPAYREDTEMRIRTLAAVAAVTLSGAAPAEAHHVTRDQLEQMVVEVFGPVAPTFRRIIACESSWDHRATHRNRNGTTDWGLLQLNDGGTLQSLGITRDQALDPLANLRAAKRLYDRRGTRPWVCSRGRR